MCIHPIKNNQEKQKKKNIPKYFGIKYSFEKHNVLQQFDCPFYKYINHNTILET